MIETSTIRLAEVPLTGHEGSLWLQLHGEREEICDALTEPSQRTSEAVRRQQELQARLRRIDDALDRLMCTEH